MPYQNFIHWSKTLEWCVRWLDWWCGVDWTTTCPHMIGRFWLLVTWANKLQFWWNERHWKACDELFALTLVLTTFDNFDFWPFFDLGYWVEWRFDWVYLEHCSSNWLCSICSGVRIPNIFLWRCFWRKMRNFKIWQKSSRSSLPTRELLDLQKWHLFRY